MVVVVVAVQTRREARSKAIRRLTSYLLLLNLRVLTETDSQVFVRIPLYTRRNMKTMFKFFFFFFETIFIQLCIYLYILFKLKNKMRKLSRK